MTSQEANALADSVFNNTILPQVQAVMDALEAEGFVTSAVKGQGGGVASNVTLTYHPKKGGGRESSIITFRFSQYDEEIEIDATAYYSGINGTRTGSIPISPQSLRHRELAEVYFANMLREFIEKSDEIYNRPGPFTSS